MYPSGESLTDLAAVAFRNALMDANMLVPTDALNAGTQMFAAPIWSIRLGGDASMVDSTQTITVPLSNPNIIVTVGRAYGSEFGYTGADSYVDADIWVPFSVWTNTADTQDVIEQYFEFARDHRQNVFSSYGLNIIRTGIVGSKPRTPSPVEGLDIMDYRWRFWYSRS